MARRTAPSVVYTAGYEGKSVRAFFDCLKARGIEVLIDVRANPISRKPGFSKHRLAETAKSLGIEYRNVRNLGIPSRYRTGLAGRDSYQRLLDWYENSVLARQQDELRKMARLTRQRSSLLMCFEKDASCCHRGRLADALSRVNGLKVVHA